MGKVDKIKICSPLCLLRISVNYSWNVGVILSDSVPLYICVLFRRFWPLQTARQPPDAWRSVCKIAYDQTAGACSLIYSVTDPYRLVLVCTLYTRHDCSHLSFAGLHYSWIHCQHTDSASISNSSNVSEDPYIFGVVWDGGALLRFFVKQRRLEIILPAHLLTYWN